tara:strand:+ start:1588 stop:1905 length:318 start_codon:yes stop_codon:yes gene_type:complete
MANDKVKFTEDELGRIKNIQQAYIDIQNNLGQVSVARFRLEQQLEGLDAAYNDLQTKFRENQEAEQGFISDITAKYGDGTLDPQTGEFTPNALPSDTSTEENKSE